MVHLCICIVTCDLCFRESVRISCLMEGSVCSCDGDTMQDELHSIHHSLAHESNLFSLCMLFCHNQTKLCLFSTRVKQQLLVSVLFMIFSSTTINTTCTDDAVVARGSLYAYVYCIMIRPMVMAVFLLAHLCLSTCLLNNTELLLTGFLSKPVYL